MEWSVDAAGKQPSNMQMRFYDIYQRDQWGPEKCQDLPKLMWEHV